MRDMSDAMLTNTNDVSRGVKHKNKDAVNLLKVIVLGVAFFPFLGTSRIIGNENVFHVLQILSSLIVTCFVIKDFKNVRLNLPTVFLLLFSLYELLVSLYNGVLSLGILFAIYFRFISVLYIIKSFSIKDYSFVRAVSIILNLLVVINLPSVIGSISMSEYDKVFMLGGKNALAAVALSAIFFNYLDYYLRASKMTKLGYSMVALSLATTLLSGSSTGIVVGVVLTLFVIFGEKMNIKFRYYVLLYLAVLFLLFNTDMIKDISFLYDFITGALNKDLTFTGRTSIWNNAFKSISENFWGYGRGNEVIALFTGATNECHNSILELMLASGIPGLMLFIGFLISCVTGKCCNKNKKIMSVCYFAIFAFMILGLTESRINDVVFWWVMIVTYCEGRYDNDAIAVSEEKG